MSSRFGQRSGGLRRRWVVISLLVGMLVLAGLVWLFVLPMMQLDQAELALKKHDPAAARVTLARYRSRHPNDERALFLAAQAARRTDGYAEAERLLTEYEQAHGKTPAWELEWLLLGVQQGDFAGQDEMLRGQLDRIPADAPAILEALGKGYQAAYRYPDALIALGKLIDANPEHIPGLILRGSILENQRKAELAEKTLRRAVELAPANTAAQIALADVLCRHGLSREAISYYELARKTHPTDAALLIGLARAHSDEANQHDAEERLNELLAAHPNHADGLVERARLAIRQGQFAIAEPYLARAIQAAPWHREAHQLLQIVLKELGKSEAITANEKRLAELRMEDGLGGRLRIRARDLQRDVAVRWELWQWSVRNGQTAEGIAWLTEILRADANHKPAHEAFAGYYEQNGQPRRAATHRTVGSPSR